MNALIAWIKRLSRLIALLAAIFGINVHAPLPMPGLSPTPPPPAPPAQVAPTPAPPVHHNIGQCATGSGRRADGSTGYYANCVVDGSSYTIPPGDFASRAAAQAAIKTFRDSNPPAS